MRRQLRHVLPELTYWFGIRGDDLDDMPMGELRVYVDRLADLPPIGGVIIYQPRK